MMNFVFYLFLCQACTSQPLWLLLKGLLIEGKDNLWLKIYHTPWNTASHFILIHEWKLGNLSCKRHAKIQTRFLCLKAELISKMFLGYSLKKIRYIFINETTSQQPDITMKDINSSIYQKTTIENCLSHMSSSKVPRAQISEEYIFNRFF